MANFGDLLGSFMQNNIPTQSGEGRIGNVLQDLQASLGNEVQGQGQGGVGGIFGNVLNMAKSTLGNASENPMQAAGLGAVLGSVLGGGGDSISGALKGGALAMLAGVAYKALTNAGQGAGGVAPVTTDAPQFSGGQIPLGLREPVSPAEDQVIQNTAQLVIKGMINVAKSDGQVSPDEVDRIVGKLKESGMDAGAESWILGELSKPLDLNAFVAEIPNQEVAAEIYTASLLAVEVDTPEERAYLKDLAEKTGLAGPVADYIQRTVGVIV